MLCQLPETKQDLLAVRVNDVLSTEDLQLYKQLINAIIAKYGSVRLYFEMKEFKGWEPLGFLENGLFDLLHGINFNRVAMVGEKEWQHWAARLASPVKKKGIRYFDLKDKDKAIHWLEEDPDKK
ncbi:STAS/SEC14 domain-containing protein [Desertivirga brevis]|uniref:STAS/SEC14 domain-containing protein n=1 Tax=Desertivirga brevis TaxID=2810310 RepID=UPI001A974EA5|nr:STAS/SEC14 domain-containing protein [Pedobacter sp. SYSU D00873]